jgi:hypothetical protein
MVEVGAAVGVGRDGSEVVSVAGIAEVSDAVPAIEKAVAGITSRQDAVHHVHAGGDGL